PQPEETGVSSENRCFIIATHNKFRGSKPNSNLLRKELMASSATKKFRCLRRLRLNRWRGARKEPCRRDNRGATQPAVLSGPRLRAADFFAAAGIPGVLTDHCMYSWSRKAGIFANSLGRRRS